MKTLYKLIILIFPVLVFSACESDGYTDDQAVGLWKQVSVTEDGVEVTLKPEQQDCKLLIEPNGMLRYYHQAFTAYNNGTGPTAFYGTWSMLDGQWINFTTDKWKMIVALNADTSTIKLDTKIYVVGNDSIVGIDTIKTVKNQWNKYHIQTRFSILQLTDSEMEIRLKTFVGEKKYALLFAPDPNDFIDVTPAGSATAAYSPILITNDNYWGIRKEYQTLKTYVFKFKKEDY
jgi:3D (Asp-Asp-Asp) domain-containing protein